MKKETVVAIIFGLILGISTAVFVSLKNFDFELAKNKIVSPKNTKNVLVTSAPKLPVDTVEITEPADGSIVEKNSIKISRTAPKNSLIIIQSPITEKVFKNSKNDFSMEIPLALGENSISVVVYPKDPLVRSKDKELKVYYIDSEL